ncbi:hypothetical protein [Devosia elaeis]|uniref:Uncharacterized protein n=1 Tax=Devosia elaeis TaxID=1770058 RepID=A0A178HZ74_9HYPH|nr:hypothetical protein [Devosia elaeis]OAM77770.1 hypothetical protein A3840_08480 [Devosia elaeis]
MQKRHMLIAIVVALIVVIFAGMVFTGVNQAPSVDGSVTSTGSENRGSDTGVAAPAAPTDTPAQ